MSDIYTSQEDENIIEQVRVYGFKTPKAPKYRVLRLALAKSLRIPTPPEEELDSIETKGTEYDLKFVTGLGKSEDDLLNQNYDDAIRALLSSYYDEDLFASDQRYRKLLQRHIRRGLREIRASWSRGHNFAYWLREELLQEINPSLSDKESDIGIDALMAALSEIGVQVDIKDLRQGIRLDRYSIYLANINHLNVLKKSLGKLAFRLGVPEDSVMISLAGEAGVANLDIPRSPERWKTVSPGRLPEWAGLPRPEKLPVWLGQTVLGEDFGMDLAEAPHVLIGGATGSGKTVCLHSLIVSLLSTKKPESLRFALIDPKGTELQVYANLPNLVSGKIVKTVLDAADTMSTLVEEMEQRNRLFAKLGVKDISEALEKTTLPRIVVIIEEL